MVETLQQTWKVQDPLEVVARLVHDALDRLAHEESLLVLLEELEASGVSDPVAYLRDLVQQDRQAQAGETQALVDYQRLPYSHLVGIETPGAMRERWRCAIWTIMRFNQGCSRSEDRWYINGRLLGRDSVSLAQTSPGLGSSSQPECQGSNHWGSSPYCRGTSTTRHLMAGESGALA